MATIKKGEGIQDIRGSSKEHVYSDWRGRGYLRSKTISGSNPRSNKQANSRSLWGWLPKVWKNQLTQVQRDTWDEYAQSFSEPGKGKLASGSIIKHHGQVQSGFNAFIRNNSLAYDAGILTRPAFIPDIHYPIGRTVSFDGVNEYVSVPDIGQSATGALQMWFCLNTLTAPASLSSYTRYRPTTNFYPRTQFFIVDIGGGDYRLLYYRTSNDATVWLVRCHGSTSILTGQWYFVVSQQTGAGEEIWVNGVKETLTYFGGSAPSNLWTAGLQGNFVAQPLMAKHAGPLGLIYFTDGCPDEVALYDDFRIPTEIAEDYDDGLGRYKFPESNLVCGYHLDEGKGTVLKDFSCLGHDGALVNTEPGDWITGPIQPSIVPPLPPTNLTCLWNGPGQSIDITWVDPARVITESRIRVWLMTYGPGAHKQQVTDVAICEEGVSISTARVADGKSSPIVNLPGRYRIQVDCVDPRGQQSPPSNICEVTVP